MKYSEEKYVFWVAPEFVMHCMKLSTAVCLFVEQSTTTQMTLSAPALLQLKVKTEFSCWRTETMSPNIHAGQVLLNHQV